MAASGFPLPGTGSVAVAARPAAAGPGNWAGAPSAVLDPAGGFVVAYRTRSSTERGGAVLVARSRDGERLETVAMVPKSRLGAESLERPAIVRTASGRWRLYVCAATPQSRHWWIAALVADRPAELAQAAPLTVFEGDDRTGVKDPVVRRDADGWRAWLCCHPLDVPGAEDRMTTAFATSPDGVAWTWHGTARRWRRAPARGTRAGPG
jgi:hypothetical protein